MKHPRVTLTALIIAVLYSVFPVTVQAKDEWLQVRSKNFTLFGNASEKDIRKVGTKLEQFRETFRLVFANSNLVSPVPTNVVVFKSDSAFKPFKPRRADGKADNFVAGYFQPGEDANYIIVSAEGNDAQMYSTIFHEYVHSIVNANFPKSEVPQWFNEGLAEYYSTFAMENDQIAKLGLPDSNHLYLLQQTKLLPLEQLLKVSNRQLHAQGDHSRSIFYAESWALVHYLIQTGKDAKLSNFLIAVINGTPPDKAFQDAFQITYAQMESELRKYVGKRTYQYHNITFKNKLDFETVMQTAPYGEAETNARLGDLLYHTNRPDDAEPFLSTALKLEPEMSMANTTLGMVKMRQRKFDEAKRYLEIATTGDQKNHLAFYRYAYLLSRESSDEFGYARSFSKETVDKMRVALKRAIALAPEFTESYELLAFIALVNNDQMDEAVTLLKTGLKYQPGNERYMMRIAELYMHQGKFDEATAVAAKFRNSEDDELRSRAESIVSQIESRKKYEQQLAGLKRRSSEVPTNGESNGPVSTTPILRKREPSDKLTEEQLAKLTEEANIRSINEVLRQIKDGEKRVVGNIEKIECKGRNISYLVKTPGGNLTLTSKDFQVLEVGSFTADANNINIGCSADLSALNAVITFKEASATKPGSLSELVSLEFVPKTFRLMSKDELSEPLKTGVSPDATIEVRDESQPTGLPPGAVVLPTSSEQGPPDLEKMRRDAIFQNIRNALREPGPGERREMAFLQKVECTNKGAFFNMKTASTVLRLFNPKPEALAIRVFAPDLGGVRLECNTSIMDFPAVLVYNDTPDKKLKSAGTIISLDFVPKSFTLN